MNRQRSKLPSLQTQEIVDRLADRFCAPAWAFLPQVRDSTGTGCARTADALAMSLWPSRGFELHGFEVKASRPDWLTELRKPDKAEMISQFCDRWWIVVGHADRIVAEGELPPTWGLMVPRGRQIIVKANAPKLSPKPIDLPFLAAILRRAAQDCPYARRKTQEYQDGVEQGKKENQRALDHEREMMTRLRRGVGDFEAASGLKLNEWTHGTNLGAAVKLMLDGGLSQLARRAEMVANTLQRATDDARATAAEINRAIAEDET